MFFSRKKYQTEIICKEMFKKWKGENPKFDNISYETFNRYWRILRSEIFQVVLDNPSGVDLPLFLGNLSVRVLDIDFTCEKDFLRITGKNEQTGEVERFPVIETDIPKKIKITWKKHRLFRAISSVLTVENTWLFKTTISRGVRERGVNTFQKAFKFDKVPSKCEEQEEVSLFDQADNI